MRERKREEFEILCACLLITYLLRFVVAATNNTERERERERETKKKLVTTDNQPDRKPKTN